MTTLPPLLLTAAQRTSSAISNGWLDVAASRSPVQIVGEPVAAERPPIGGSGDSRRDPLLDLLRAVALVRVVAWHTVPVAALTWIAAMPVMFVVAGALLAEGADRHHYRDLVARRGRRLLVPLWGYGAFVALVAAAVVARSGASGASPSTVTVKALTWVLPVVDPAGPAWLTSPLWYVRAYLWLVLAAPLLVACARAWRRSVVLAATAVAMMELAAHHDWWTGSTRVLVGDVVTYGLFALLGAAWTLRRAERRLTSASTAIDAVASLPARARWSFVVAGIIAAVGAAAWTIAVGAPGGVVSNSYPLTVLVGLVTVCVLALAEVPLRRFAATPRVATATRAIGRRGLTVYLWHTAGVALGAAVLDRHGLSADLGRAAIVVVVIAVAVVSVGRLEDVVAARPAPAPFGPGRRTMRLVGGVALFAVAVPLVLVDAPDGERAARPPSWRAPLTDAAFGHDAPGPAPARPAPVAGSNAVPAAELHAALDAWRLRHGLTSASVAISVDGRVWEARSGSTTDASMQEGVPYGIASVSKLVTATLVLQAAGEGLLDIDAPVPELAGLPPRPWRPTPRQLLRHSAGLVDPPTVGKSRAAAIDAVAAALAPPAWRPGPTDVPAYASTNSIYLGLVLEHVTGRTFEDLVAGLAATHHLPSFTSLPGPGAATGGITATADDLARFGEALLGAHTVLPAATIEEMTRFDDGNVGLGVWPGCPCYTDAAGHKRASAVGHHTGAGGLYVWPGELSLAVRMTGVASTDEGVAASLDLGQIFRTILR